MPASIEEEVADLVEKCQAKNVSNKVSDKISDKISDAPVVNTNQTSRDL